MKTHAQLTTEEQQHAVALARAELATEIRDYLLGNNRETMPVQLQPVVRAFDAAALARAQGRNYLTTAAERDAIPLDS